MNAIAQALSVALLDFVWQGLWIAFALWAILLFLKDRSPLARYRASALALAAMAILPVITALLAYRAHSPGQPASGWSNVIPHVAIGATAAGIRSLDWSTWLQRWALPAWALGVLLFSIRLVWSARHISQLRRRSTAPEAVLLAQAARLAERMHLARPARVLITQAADCPSVVGWIRPVVLLPAATLVGLTPQQLEAVLAHELAHIRRYDYLFNMLQSIVETLLFYHPAVWWVSSRMRRERELCCDDMAVNACGDALCYARALTRLERLRLTAPGMALGSTGGPLMYRIRRIVGEAHQTAPSKLPGILALSLGLLTLTIHMPWARAQQPETPAAAVVTRDNVVDDEAVTVNAGNARIIERRPVEYPGAALEKGIQGTVVVEVTLDAAGAVTDARVLSGPAELRKAALQSVLEWQFADAVSGSTREVSITFQPPDGSARVVSDGVSGGVGISGGIGGGVSGGVSGGIGGGVSSGVSGGIGGGVSIAVPDGIGGGVSDMELQARLKLLQEEAMRKAIASQELNQLDAKIIADDKAAAMVAQAQAVEQQLQILRQHSDLTADATAIAESQKAQIMALEKRLAELQGLTGRRLKAITIAGLGDSQRDALLSMLPMQVGDTLSEDSLAKIRAAVDQFDPNLGLSLRVGSDGEVEIRIAPPRDAERHL
jgi:TonB family protein